MRKKKMHIPFPDDKRIELEIEKIVTEGIPQQPTFWTSIKTMVQQIGFRQLFSDRSEQTYLLLMVMFLGVNFIISPDPSTFEQEQELYAFLFLVSPVLFLAFSVYTYAKKMENGTYEVEMACKYNVYQVVACRMLVFSMMAIVTNVLMIAGFVALYEHVEFLRALAISTTGLFVFSVLFLSVMCRRRSVVAVIGVTSIWVTINILCKQINAHLYNDVLVHLPLIVYAIVLIGAMYMYVLLLKKFMQQSNAEGVF